LLSNLHSLIMIRTRSWREAHDQDEHGLRSDCNLSYSCLLTVVFLIWCIWRFIRHLQPVLTKLQIIQWVQRSLWNLLLKTTLFNLFLNLSFWILDQFFVDHNLPTQQPPSDVPWAWLRGVWPLMTWFCIVKRQRRCLRKHVQYFERKVKR